MRRRERKSVNSYPTVTGYSVTCQSNSTSIEADCAYTHCERERELHRYRQSFVVELLMRVRSYPTAVRVEVARW
jgi:hypothetical protein